MPDRVVVEELDLLGKVSALLKELPEAKTANEAPIVRELERLRSVILSGDEAKDVSALSEQYHHQAAVLNQLRTASTGPPIDPGSPYFAHLRLREAGKERDLCLGRGTCIEGGVRIVDWRDAPISKIFYNYSQGDDYDEEIAGRERVGEVIARRMLRIRDGWLERVQAPEGDYTSDESIPGGWRYREPSLSKLGGGEASAVRGFRVGEGLNRQMGSSADGSEMRVDKHLPEITGLIDPNQFDLITRNDPGFLAIRGAAGSGKTTVALHRVAYLAFEDPRVDGPETLVVVFSRALRNFVGHLLPTLGLSKVHVVDFREWMRDERRRHFRRLPIAERHDTPAWIQRLKLHTFLGSALERYIEKTSGPRTPVQAITDWASVLKDGDFLYEIAEQESPGVFKKKEIHRFVEWHQDRLDAVFAEMAGDKSAHAKLDPEDDALLLRAWQLRVGRLQSAAKRELRLRHLVIDEVQDFAPIEVKVLLGCVDPKGSITLSGDTQQHLMMNTGFSSWSDFFECLGVRGTEVETLRVSYRSSRQIVEFGRSILGDLVEDQELDAPREGPPVELFRFTDRGACVAFLADTLRQLVREEPVASVAVLAPSSPSCAAYFEGLERCDLPRLQWVRDQEFSFSAGVEIAETADAKGLEFDYVIMVDVDASAYPEKDEARRLLHVGTTRAIHQLWLMTVGTPSPLVKDAWQY